MWMTKKDVCFILGIKERTLNKRMHKGLIPYYKQGTNQQSRVLFKVNDIHNYIAKTRVISKHEYMEKYSNA